MQGYKTTKESVENERNKERRDEVHRYGTSLTENKEEKRAVEENHAIDKRQRQDAERHQAEGETKSDETGYKKR